MSKKEEQNLDPKPHTSNPPIDKIDQVLYQIITELIDDSLNSAMESENKQEQNSKKANEEEEHPRTGSNELGLEEIEESLKALLKVQPVEDSKNPHEGDQTKSSNASCSPVVIDNGSLKNLKALFSAPVRINIRQLRDKTSRFMSEGKAFQGMGAKMYALLSEGEVTDFKNDEGDGKKSFLELLKEYDESDDDWETLEGLKNAAVDQATDLCHLVVDLMFLMPDDKQLVEKFKVIATTLKWVCKGENNSVVIRRIVDLLDEADTEMRKKMEPKIAHKPVRVMGVEIEEVWFGNHEDALEEDDTDISIIGLLKETFRLECFWTHRGLLDSNMSVIDAFELLLAEQAEFEKAWKMIELGVRDLIESYVNTEEISDEHRVLDWKINELWKRIEESEKK